ncbi:MAG: Class II abasic (AP) endonuclease [Caeruleum heppii]|nr:MAG: Class II abasic (AP) endonuclease [Caeruleum heppii]
MVLRITSWNVNGIRNPFGYQPWRDKRTYDGMFEILEADIVVMQETKIQRKDLRDDMVLVPGWDCYFSLPKHKKGYSGVAIYTKQSVCAPIRAEEGITGRLQPPNASIPYIDLPEDQQIGGYPTEDQLGWSAVDAAVVDSEGRCVILEFPALVLIGVYCPANRDETRDDFRLGFLNALDARVRNLTAIGKRVFLTGDLNISREEIDAAHAEEQLKKHEIDGESFVCTPARRLFNQLLEGGKVIGDRDEGREHPVLWDICRGFHPGRKGMYTCWEQKINARPGNYGARIDYVLCSIEMKDWFCDSNIQEGLMGSDHCPVYATIRDAVSLPDCEEEIPILDLMNPPGTFVSGKRLREYSMKDIPALSGKLIQEFDRRRSIRDMFTKKPSSVTAKGAGMAPDSIPASIDTSSTVASPLKQLEFGPVQSPTSSQQPSKPASPAKPNGSQVSLSDSATTSPIAKGNLKRSSANHTSSSRPLKRGKSNGTSAAPAANGAGGKGGQQSLKGFFAPKAAIASNSSLPAPEILPTKKTKSGSLEELSPERDTARTLVPIELPATPERAPLAATDGPCSPVDLPKPSESPSALTSPTVHDPIVSKESWSKLFTKRATPLCEGHSEPCISLLTKKAGVNCGRSFWMCARPLGPSGGKERGTQWRCQTFIWCSDWNGGNTGGGGGGGR